MGLRGRKSFLDYSCFFITTSCNKMLPLIELSNGYSILEESIKFINLKYKAEVLAYVIMPNHFHFVLYFKDKNFLSEYMRDLKKFTSTKIRQKLDQLGEQRIVDIIRSNETNRAFQVWNIRFDDVVIQSMEIAEIKINYIHNNPLQERWNLSDRIENYKYSSARYYELGIQPNLIITDYREVL